MAADFYDHQVKAPDDLDERAADLLAASPQLREAIEFGLAWQRAEKALPDESYAIDLRGSRNWFGKGPRWIASAYPSDGRRKAWQAEGPTPTAALDALTTALEAREP